MNAADESLGNVLLVGLGAVAIQVALDLRRHGAGRLGALNHPGRRSQRIAEALARGACLQLEGQGQHRWLSGNAALDVFHQDPAELRDDWQTLVLCVPADSYLDVVRGLPWERLGGCARCCWCPPSSAPTCWCAAPCRRVPGDRAEPVQLLRGDQGDRRDTTAAGP